MDTIVEIQTIVTVIDFRDSTQRCSKLILKRRKESFSDKTVYFRNGPHGIGIISKSEYDDLLKENNAFEKETIAKLLKNL